MQMDDHCHDEELRIHGDFRIPDRFERKIGRKLSRLGIK